ncbi:MAG: Ig-like domain-containing protein, partial [Duncaniella sp.]|nr:Ig-like domain-containing protein [Duncaniella sp.]
APTVVDGKNMYEAGTKVTLKALPNPIMAFTNWSDGQSSTEITVTMDADKEYTGIFSPGDFITAWDFYLPGASSRPADFYAEDNDAAVLILRDAQGNLSSWLDKSEQAAGGFEGRPGATNWTTAGLGTYYWQTTVNASAFTAISVEGAMAYNFNAYTTYDVEASLDGTEWTKIGSVKIEGAKKWKDYRFDLPAKFDNAPSLSLRWIADKSSATDGTYSEKDGITLGAIYITGTPKLVNDGTAPVLLSYVPAEGSDNASITGKIVLNFDEKVKMAAGAKGELAGAKLEPAVTGKTVTFPYKNLAYGTEYTFTLPAGAVMDLCDNATAQAISIKFTTRTKPEIEKALYDFIVPDDGTIGDAVAAAEAREDVTKRFRIFFRNGSYVFPLSADKTKTGADGKEYADPTTYITTPNISFIGESTKGVVITNAVPGVEIDTQYGPANVLEGIGKGDVLRLEKKATGCYFQNLTLKSAMGDSRGRDIVLNDNSDKTIFKDACLWAYQDTYVSNNENGRFYFEGGVLRGRTDYVCGKGDVYYQAVNFQVVGEGGYISAPSKPKQYGYIFNECEITGETSAANGKYTLGRPWGSGTPIALYINTVMKAQPKAEGWNEMSGGWPARMAEYNSVTAAGTPIDLSKRKKFFAETHENNPVLSKSEAEWYTIENVLGQDGWDPAMTAEQAPEVTGLKSEGYVLSWDNNNYTSLWAVCGKNGIIGFTTEPKFEIPAADFKAGDTYGVRAANEMGGLGAQVDVTAESGISSVTADSEAVSTVWYNLQGIRVAEGAKGILIKVETLANGRTVTTKTVVE